MARRMKNGVHKYVSGTFPVPIALTGPDSSSGRAYASVAVGRGFETRPRHTKGITNGTSGYLAWRSAL